MKFFSKRATKLIIIGLTIIFLIINSANGRIVPTGTVGMKNMSDDVSGDPGSLLDLKSLHMGETNQYLVFIVEYYEPDGSLNGLYSNITMRNEAGDLFLLLVWVDSNNNFILLTHATSLEDDNKNTGESDLFVEYQNRVMWNYTEIHFYIDWADIGGNQEMDVVVWTDLPRWGAYDRIPDEGHLTYSGVDSVDTSAYLEDVTSDWTTTGYPGTEYPTVTTSTTIISEPVLNGSKGSTTDQGDPIAEEESFTLDLPVSNLFFLSLLLIPLINKKIKKSE